MSDNTRAADVPTMDEFNALSEQVAMQGAELNDLDARVTALEGGGQAPGAPSPDGATVTDTSGAIIDAQSRSFTLVGSPDNYKIHIDGQLSQWTQYVAQLQAWGGVCHQQNQDGNWWNMPANEWVECADPMAPPDTGNGGETPPDTETPPGGGTPPDSRPPYSGSVDFGRATGKTVCAELFGIGTGALENNDYAACDDQQIVSQLAVIAPRCFRLHAQHQMAEQVAAGNRTAFNRWVSTFPRFLPAGAMQIIGVGPPFNDTSIPPQQRGSNAAALARAFIEAGCEQFWWEVGNEPSGGLDCAHYSEHFVACADALHAINPAYKIGGTTASWWGEMNIRDWVSRVTPGRVGFFDFHSYPVNNESEIYSKALAWGDVRASRDELRKAGVADNVPIMLLEWNQNGGNHDGIWGISCQTDHRGALYFALLLQTGLEQDDHFTAAACWDAYGDSYFGQIGPAPAYDNSVITPSGHYLRVAGERVRGKQVEASAGLSNFRVLAAVDGKRFALQCVNYDTQHAQTWNPEFKGATVASLDKRTDVGKGCDTGADRPATLPIAVDPECIAIVTGTLQ